jgi:hypothetical protein
MIKSYFHSKYFFTSSTSQELREITSIRPLKQKQTRKKNPLSNYTNQRSSLFFLPITIIMKYIISITEKESIVSSIVDLLSENKNLFRALQLCITLKTWVPYSRIARKKSIKKNYKKNGNIFLNKEKW